MKKFLTFFCLFGVLALAGCDGNKAEGPQKSIQAFPQVNQQKTQAEIEEEGREADRKAMDTKGYENLSPDKPLPIRR